MLVQFSIAKVRQEKNCNDLEKNRKVLTETNQSL